ncbi:MAG: cytochrome c oxidase subunit II [Synechococcaceae cyanobacterium]|nr:cytochrome c oxidase subunit II [Synechococcaceae cyanobacterium]
MTTPLPRSGAPVRRPWLPIGLALLANLLASLWMRAQVPLWLPVAASSAAPHVDGLFALETAIGTFLFLGCVEVMLWSVLFHRANKYDLDNGDPIEGNTRLEIVWTLIPLVVVMAIAWHTIRVDATLATLGGKERVRGAEEALQVAADAAGGPIQVIARQWSWEFVYANGVRSAELHLPVDQPAAFELVSLDVLHGFFIPAFRLKQDVVPGSVIRYRLTPTRIGRYRLRDSMFSGGYFATNQADVVVESDADFRRWLQEAAARPLAPSWNAAQESHRRRLERGDRGWAVVPPAPPPLVHVGLDPQASHEA